MVADEAVPARLWWGLRHYASILVLGALIGGLGATLLPGAGPQIYRAEALLVAKELGLDTAELPGLIDAVFNTGAVAEAVVADREMVPYDVDQLIPDHMTLETPSTVAARVVGVDSDPELAATVANRGAEALVEELNSLGQGIGSFEVLDVARVPEAPLDKALPDGLIVLGGVLAGAVVALTVMLGHLALRRPLISGKEVSDLLSLPVIGSVELPVTRSGVSVHEVPGLWPLAKQLFPGRRGTRILLSPDRHGKLRARTAELLCTAVARFGDVTLVRNGQPSPSEGWTDKAQVRLTSDLRFGYDANEGPIVVDGVPTWEVIDELVASCEHPVVLVIPEGTTAREASNLAAEFLTSEMYGIVFVAREHGWLRWLASRRRAPGSVVPSQRPVPSDDCLSAVRE